jgi:hypothetical protein
MITLPLTWAKRPDLRYFRVIVNITGSEGCIVVTVRAPNKEDAKNYVLKNFGRLAQLSVQDIGP